MEVTAYHEAGHALMAILMGAKVRMVTIEPERDDGPLRYGETQIEWDLTRFSGRDWERRKACVALAGPVAEAIHTGEPFHPGLVGEWAPDWQLAWTASAALATEDRKRLRLLEQITRDVFQTLNRTEVWAAVAAIVDQLLAHETIEGEDLEAEIRVWL